MTSAVLDTRAQFDRVASVYLPIALAVFVVVVGAIGLFVWRGVRRASPTGPEERPVAEGIYVAVLAAIVALLVTVTFTAQAKIQRIGKHPALAVSVFAGKWNWRFHYPAYGIDIAGRPGVPATLVVPAGREILFTATSADVLHGFWIPSRRFQRQIAPGRQTTFGLTFPRPGLEPNAPCAVYCGLGHADMRFRVRILEPSAFEAWARTRGGGR